MFRSTNSSSSAFYAAVKSAYLLLKPSGGKIIIFKHSNPGNERAGNPNQTSWDLNNIYERIAEESALAKISIDLFQFFGYNSALSCLSRRTCGKIFYYSLIDPNPNPLVHDFLTSISSTTAINGRLSINCSSGITVESLDGSFYSSLNETHFELINVDPRKSLTIKLKYDGTLIDKSYSYFQTCLTYTVPGHGQKLRVHTLRLPTTTSFNSFLKGHNEEAILHSFATWVVKEKLYLPYPQASHQIIEKCADILVGSRKRIVNGPYLEHMICPNLVQFPLHVLSVIKRLLIPADEIDYSQKEEKAYQRALFSGFMSVDSTRKFLCPELFELEDLITNEKPTPLSLSKSSLSTSHAFVLNDLFTILVWIGNEVTLDVGATLVRTASTLNQADFDNPLSHFGNETELGREFLRLFLKLRCKCRRFTPVVVVQQGHLLEGIFLSLLTEDATLFISYRDFYQELEQKVLSRMQVRR
eukprot:TRINITY_DN777_c0_g1_i1.p1 TRINITY_DN777_c0_g1~~TRINITY_DN777_c0_g1_i1.p1  ORF type:complete len:471 (-),score=57.03 TRINITY_DN777_c0_g1_i1:76-1488(-)